MDMTSLQAVQRALSLSANVMMASTSFTKHTGCTGILRFLLLGILLPSVLASGRSSSPNGTILPSTSSTDDSPTNTADFNITTNATANTGTTAMAQPPSTTISASTAANTTTQSPTNLISASSATTNSTNPPTSTISASTVSNTSKSTNTSTTTNISTATSTATSTAAKFSTSDTSAMTTTSLQSSTMTTTSTASTTVPTTTVDADVSAAMISVNVGSDWISPSSSMSASSDSSTTMMSTNDTSGMNGTTPLNSSMSMIYCHSFICNYSDCYTMYTTQNATSCTDGYCQLIRLADMCYTVGCSPSCVDSCINATYINCSVNCCKSTGCLSDNFKAMMMKTTTVTATSEMTTTTTTLVTTTTATNPQTTADNKNKCHQGTCTGTDCYKDFINAQPQKCSSSQIHCQLKKETIDSQSQWTAGCTTNCSGQTPCKTSTQPPCHLECCNATMTSCLWLNGTLNVPSLATRGPHLNTELIASLLCLLAITLLL